MSVLKDRRQTWPRLAVTAEREQYRRLMAQTEPPGSSADGRVPDYRMRWRDGRLGGWSIAQDGGADSRHLSAAMKKCP